MGKLMLNDVCYSSGGSGQVFTGATATTAGTQGEVPAPAAGDQAKYLRADGNWATPPGSGGSTVIITPTLSSGTKVADYEKTYHILSYVLYPLKTDFAKAHKKIELFMLKHQIK